MNLLWKRVSDLTITKSLRLQSGAVLQHEGRSIPAGSIRAVDRTQHNDKVILLDTASGSVCTLPAATGSGMAVTFMVSTALSSNNHVVKVGNTTDVLVGGVVASGDNITNGVTAFEPVAADDTLTLNGGTTGGRVGDRVELYDLKAGFWAINGRITEVGAEATPFSATV